MKIIHLITDLNVGGAELTLFHLLKSIDRQKFDCKVVSLTPLGPIAQKIEELGLTVHSLDMQPGHPSFRGLRKLIKLLKQEQPQILQTWLYHADLLGAFAVIFNRKTSLVWNIRTANMDMSNYRRLSKWTLKACTWSSRFPRAVVVNSKAGQLFHSSLGYRPRRWVLITNGVDTDRFKPDLNAYVTFRLKHKLSVNTPLIGLIARYDPIKDHANFFAAAGILIRELPDVRFVLAGENIDYENSNIIRMIEQANLSEKVILLGGRDNIPLITSALDIATSSSYCEGFSNTIAEGMACGVPCVVTDVGDSAHLVGESGIVVPPREPQAMANKLKILIEMGTEKRQSLGREARERILKNFSLANMVNQYQTLYNDLEVA